MTDRPRALEAVADLLREASRLHHDVYRITDGDDPDWASWYAAWLVNLSELPEVIGTKPVRSELVWLLVELDREFAATAPDRPWEEYYAERIVQRFAAG